MNQEEQKNHIVTLGEYEGSHLAKSYKSTEAEAPKMSLIDTVNMVAKSCNDGFKAEKTSEEDLNKAFDQLEGKLTEHLEKSEPGMTFERSGELGDYSYELVEKSDDDDADDEEDADEEEEADEE